MNNWMIVLWGAVAIASCRKKDALEHIDKQALFAPATTAEIREVKQIWAARDLTPGDAKIEETRPINAALQLHIISFMVSGIKEYAGVLESVSAKPLPVQLYVGGYAIEAEPVNSVDIKLADASLPFIYVVPALRGQYVSVKVNDILLRSPLSAGRRADAFDGATDDVIACLTAVGLLFPMSDTGRAMIRGGSRGGIVGLLAAERDARFKRAAAVAFNVDFIGLTAGQYNDRTYKEQFLQGLLDGSATIAQTRQLMIASSPLYFCEQLPKTQLHSGENDRITPAAQGELLLGRMTALNLQDRVSLFIYPGRTHDNIGTGNPEMENRINNFFAELW